ncbi:MAG: ABC transporter permease subunit [Planctomycetota bacterium]
MKYRIIKAIDVCGLNFLTPIVRLCYGEEPDKQLKDIGRFIVVPVLAFGVFVAMWGYLAPRHKTKYGAVPTPAQTWRAFCAMLTIHDRETSKAEAFVAGEERRRVILDFTVNRLAELDPLASDAKKMLAEAREEESAAKEALITPINEELSQLKDSERAGRKEKEAALKEMAESLEETGGEGRVALIEAVRELGDWRDEQKELQAPLKDKIKAIRDEKTPAVVAALAQDTLYQEEIQYLKKLQEMAGDKSREETVAAGEAKLAAYEEEYASAAGSAALSLAKKQVTQIERIAKDREKTYAMPWTLPKQAVRSVMCVFSGFFVGVAIAIPLGVLCGLSKTFMAAMTPFIALFKPVSPIVWVLILWIIVGGFFPDPASSPFLGRLNDLVNAVFVPLTLWLVPDFEINPAFIASALTVSMCSLWATMTNTALGVASVDPDHYNVARVLRLGFWSRLFKIVLPSALPLVFAGMRISLGVGWMVLIAAELIASSEGIGKYVNDMFQNGDVRSFAFIMMAVFIVGAIGLVLDRIMIVLQRAVSFDGAPTAI